MLETSRGLLALLSPVQDWMTLLGSDCGMVKTISAAEVVHPSCQRLHFWGQLDDMLLQSTAPFRLLTVRLVDGSSLAGFALQFQKDRYVQAAAL